MQIFHYPQSSPASALLGSGSWVTGDTSSQPPLPPKDGLGAGVCSVNPRHLGQKVETLPQKRKWKEMWFGETSSLACQANPQHQLSAELLYDPVILGLLFMQRN